MENKMSMSKEELLQLLKYELKDDILSVSVVIPQKADLEEPVELTTKQVLAEVKKKYSVISIMSHCLAGNINPKRRQGLWVFQVMVNKTKSEEKRIKIQKDIEEK